MSRINIEIPNEDHKKIKVLAAATSVSIREFVIDAIKEKIGNHLFKIPNEDTLEAFKQTDANVKLTTYNNTKDLFDNLGLNQND